MDRAFVIIPPFTKTFNKTRAGCGGGLVCFIPTPRRPRACPWTNGKRFWVRDSAPREKRVGGSPLFLIGPRACAWGSMLFIGLIFAVPVSAQDVFVIEPVYSTINFSVRYVAIGNYKAVFENFSGTIRFDSENIEGSTLRIEIDIDSIKSEHPRLDKLARSKRLMHAKRYPKAIFMSESIEKTTEGYKAIGVLNFHGVSKEVSFPFTVEGPYMDYGKVSLIARGQLIINRKEFNIIWNSVLDHGGIIVSNQIVLDWEMLAVRQNSNP